MGSVSEVLVAFVSAGGATSRYSDVIAETLRGRGFHVELVDLKHGSVPSLEGYDAVVVGMGVRMTMVYRKGRKFLRRSELKNKPLAVFLSSGMAIDDPEKAKNRFLTPLIERNSLQPVMAIALPGKMPGEGGRLKDRSDPERARQWAEELADLWKEGADARRSTE